jgi:hypothetical protein
MIIRNISLALAVSLFIGFSGCGQDQDIVSKGSGIDELTDIKRNLIGKWSLFSDNDERIPQIISNISDKNFIYLSSNFIFNDDNSFTNTQIEYLEGYEEYPIILTSKGIYAVDSISIMSFNTTEYKITTPDEIKQILIDNGMYSENPEIPKEVKNSFAFNLDGDTLTFFIPRQDEQGSQKIDSKIYIKK